MLTAVTTVHGMVAPGSDAVESIFRDQFARHPNCGPPSLGASVCVVLGGQTVVDLWGGWADAARTRPWGRDTVSLVASCTKGRVALVVHRLVDAGHLGYDDPVAEHWPEYATYDKRGVTVRHVL